MARSAAAQSPDAARANSALAEGLFQEAKALLRNNDLPAACEKFTESLRIEAALGTLLNLAVCHRDQGKTASAWSEFSDALALAERSEEAERARFSRSELERLRPMVPHLIVKVSPGAPDPQLSLDGSPLRKATWGTAIPLDPGVHRIQAEAPGRKPWHLSIALTAGGAITVAEIPVLESAEAVGSLASRQAAWPPRAAKERAASAETRRQPRTRGTWGLVAGGVSIAALGAGTFWGIRVLTKRSVVRANCDGPWCRNETGMAADQDAHQAARWATLSFGVGILAGGLSAYLFATDLTPNVANAARRKILVRPGPVFSLATSATGAAIHARVSF